MDSLYYACVEYGNYTLWVVAADRQVAIDALINALDSDITIGPLTEEEVDYYVRNMSVYPVRVGEVQWD